MGTWWLSLRNNRNYCSEVWTTFIWPLPNRTKKDRPAFESSHQCRPHFRRSNTCRNHHDHDFANYEQKMIIIVSMIIQLMIKMILMFFQLIIMFRHNHANDNEQKMILKETRLHSRTGRLPSRPDQSSVSRPWVADYYPESTSWRDLFLFCILKSQTGFRMPSTSAVGGPWSLWWEVVGLGIRLTCNMIFHCHLQKDLSSIFTKISMFMISI